MVRFDLVVTLSDKRTRYSTSNVLGNALSVIGHVISHVIRSIEYLLQVFNPPLARSWRSLLSHCQTQLTGLLGCEKRLRIVRVYLPLSRVPQSLASVKTDLSMESETSTLPVI